MNVFYILFNEIIKDHYILLVINNFNDNIKIQDFITYFLNNEKNILLLHFN